MHRYLRAQRWGVVVKPRLSSDERAYAMGEARAFAFNGTCPQGSPVVLVDDNGHLSETKTRSEAWCLGDGSPVVLVDGRTGGYALERIFVDAVKVEAQASRPRTFKRKRIDDVVIAARQAAGAHNEPARRLKKAVDALDRDDDDEKEKS